MKSIPLVFALLIGSVAGATASAHVVPQPGLNSAPAPSPATSGKPSVAAAAVDDDAMVCERVKELGSNMLKRVCKTVAQRDREREAARDALNTRSRDR